jgi:hypothetical protein
MANQSTNVRAADVVPTQAGTKALRALRFSAADRHGWAYPAGFAAWIRALRFQPFVASSTEVGIKSRSINPTRAAFWTLTVVDPSLDAIPVDHNETRRLILFDIHGSANAARFTMLAGAISDRLYGISLQMIEYAQRRAANRRRPGRSDSRNSFAQVFIRGLWPATPSVTFLGLQCTARWGAVVERSAAGLRCAESCHVVN